MKANVTLENDFKAYSVVKFDVKVGKSLFIELTELGSLGVEGKPVKWFANNDPVLQIEEDMETGKTAEVVATHVGKSTIQLQDSEGATILKLSVEVIDTEAQGFRVGDGKIEPIQ